ncbi:hypothetical protein GR160_08350 [Flavobacterium sp. Sd200]|uniref:hypothetical protein n=1 Tax=Flavobacterium sp. Sd200 TaxID=2692211 RepID=UPI001371C3F4|nr:hypothetical protein [Flavobacterium sp. Sd200]MXN91238.1 hypothetical protein [Flavobacterium sp. Sd200]
MKSSTNPVVFNYYVLKRIFKILLRRQRSISMLYIDYAWLPNEDINEVEIKYRFRNALWFKTNDKTTMNNRITLPKPKESNEVKLIVQGLFRKNEYRFKLMHDHILLLK